jgi:hypothetical protein
MKYYLIYNADGDTSVHEYNKDELLDDLDGGSWPKEDALESMPDNDTNRWGGKYLLIKGEIITPLKREVVTKHDLP